MISATIRSSLFVLILVASRYHAGAQEKVDIQKLDPNMTLEKADDKGIAWFDPRHPPFRLTGFPWIDEERVYRRLPVKPHWEIRKPVDDLANCTAGGQIQFQSDSEKIMIRVELRQPSGMYHMPATGQSGFDLYVGEPGHQRYHATSRFDAQAGDYEVVLFEGAKAQRHFTLNFPLYNGVRSVQVGVMAGSSIAAPVPYTQLGSIVVYGTSITQGGCAARPGMAYTNILSRRLNREFVNLGFSGNGRGEPALARLINQIDHQRLVVLDYQANAGESIRDTLEPFIDILREAHRDLPILVISKIRYARELADPEKLKKAEDLARFQKELVDRRTASGDRSLYFLDGGTLLGEHAHECTVDGVHPTDLGFLKMANTIEPTIASILQRNADAAPARAETNFVKNGNPKLIRALGCGWEFEKDAIFLMHVHGSRATLYGGRQVADGDFRVRARLTVPTAQDRPSLVVSAQGDLEGFEPATATRPPAEFLRHHHLCLHGMGYQPGRPFDVELLRTGNEFEVRIDGLRTHTFQNASEPFGMVGFSAYEGQLRIHDFSIQGKTGPLTWKRSLPIDISVPTVDLSEEEERQVVIEKIPGTYLGHPDTVLLPDGKTLYCVYPPGHAGDGVFIKKSSDGGLTWSKRLKVPENWKTGKDVPTIHRLTGPDGVARLIQMSGGHHASQAVSIDDGVTWSPMKPNGLHCWVAPNRVIPISGNRHLILYAVKGERDRPQDIAIAQAISSDGGLTWEESVLPQHPDALPDEPGVIKSPNGKQVAAVMREESRAYNSMLMTSDDEGTTWSPFREVSAAVTGDRHNLAYAPDGRLVAVFRDTAPASPSKGHFVAWVGAYEDLVNGKEGQYRILLLRNRRPRHDPRWFDCGYAGLDVLPDGTFVATTYTVHKKGEEPSVVSVRFRLDETDRRVGRK
jgi:lysophospholipase L1-like esterase